MKGEDVLTVMLMDGLMDRKRGWWRKSVRQV